MKPATHSLGGSPLTFFDDKMVSGVDLKCDCFHILQCTKLLFVCFLPELGREYAHGLFFTCFQYKIGVED